MRAAPAVPQGGLVLFIALIVLVAMTLAGIALMRSVDTALVVAGNMAFKQSAISVADRGTQEAAAWLVANSSGQNLHNDNPGAGYSASIPPGLPEPDWFDMNSWANSFVVNGGTPDAAGNVVRYVVHRLCNAAGNPNGTACALYFGTSIGGHRRQHGRGRAGLPGHPAALLSRDDARGRSPRHRERDPEQRPRLHRRHLTPRNLHLKEFIA